MGSYQMYHNVARGRHDHITAAIHWHSKIKKCGYQLNKLLYMEKVVMGAMGVQGFQQNWTGLVVKVTSHDLPSAKLVT